MKTLFVSLLIINSFSSMSQHSEEQAIKQLITAFESATAKQNISKLKPLLNTYFRVAMNQLFGSTEISIMDRDTYIDKIEKKVFGGETRKITFHNITIADKTATAQVSLAGATLTLQSLYSLVKTSDDQWQILEDLPRVVSTQ